MVERYNSSEQWTTASVLALGMVTAGRGCAEHDITIISVRGIQSNGFILMWKSIRSAHNLTMVL